MPALDLNRSQTSLFQLQPLGQYGHRLGGPVPVQAAAPAVSPVAIAGANTAEAPKPIETLAKAQYGG
jgi:hypothetical protein